MQHLKIYLLATLFATNSYACLSLKDAKKEFVSVPASIKKSVDSLMSSSLASLQNSEVKEGASRSRVIDLLPENIQDHYETFTEMFSASTDGKVIARAQKLMHEISPHALDHKMHNCYNVQVLKSDIPNAFNTGCNVYITTRTLNILDDDEVKAVFAHELSHGDQGHYSKNFYYIFRASMSHVTSLYFDVYLSLFTDDELYYDTMKNKGHIQSIMDTYSETGLKVELNADLGAVYILKNAGIDQKNLITALYKMTANSSEINHAIDFNSQLDIQSEGVRDYPSLSERINAIKSTCVSP